MMPLGPFLVALAGIAMVTIICVTPFILVAWIIASRRRGHAATSEERRQMDALLAGLDRMERRADNLETILRREGH